MPESLTPEALVYDFKQARDPQISPDGQWIVYSLATVSRDTKKEETQLWLCDRDGEQFRQLTFAGTRNTAARWDPDGRRIAFVSNRDGEGNGLFVMTLDGGDPREVIRHRVDIAGIAWSRDGGKIAYVADYDPDNPNETPRDPDAAPKVRVTSREDYKQDGAGYRGEVRKQIFVVDVASGERRRLTSGRQDFFAPVWSPDGARIAAGRICEGNVGSQLALIDVVTGETQTLLGPTGGTVEQWSWSPDGSQLAIASEDGHTNQSDVRRYDVEKDELETVVADLTWNPSGGYVAVMAAPPVWLDERRVFFSGVRGGGAAMGIVDMQNGDVEMVRQTQSMTGTVTVDASNTVAVRAYTSLDARGEIEIMDLRERRGRLLTDYSSEVLEQRPAALWERYDVERGGYTIEAWMLKPADFDESKKYPVVLDIHGGPNNYYGYDFNPTHQALAAAGFIVVYSNPRGSGSYGREFSMQVFQDWGGEDYLDLMAVLDAALERPYCDAERTGVRGYSYGGYMTAWIIGQTDRFRAAVCGAPCFDLESFWGTSDIGVPFGNFQFGGAPHEIPEWYAKHSPSNFAHRVTTPTLIVHGEADERCPIGQGEQMFTALKHAGCEVEFARYPGGAHPFVNSGPPEHRRDLLERTNAWFRKYLGGPQ